jgi:ATP-dependent DNA helicase RecQ
LKRAIVEGKVDALLISPERLANDNFVQEVLQPIADRIDWLSAFNP